MIEPLFKEARLYSDRDYTVGPMKNDLKAFRLGDIRGLYPEEVNESFAVDFAHAFVDHFRVTGPIATGRDMRVSSSVLQDALNQGFRESGIDVVDLGLCATELGYFASTRDGIDAAIIGCVVFDILSYLILLEIVN